MAPGNSARLASLGAQLLGAFFNHQPAAIFHLPWTSFTMWAVVSILECHMFILTLVIHQPHNTQVSRFLNSLERGLGALHSDLVVSLVSVRQAQVEVLDVQLQEGQDELQ